MNNQFNSLTFGRDKITKNISSIAEMLELRAQNTPDKVLYKFIKSNGTENYSLTYKELHQKAQAIAIELLKHSHRGDRALLVYAGHEEFITAFFACLYAGVTAVPVKAAQPKNAYLNNMLSIAKNAQVSLLLTTSTIKSVFDNNPATAQFIKQIKVLLTTAIRSDKEQFKIKTNAEDIAFLQYTSGSTGNPKGVMVTHKNILHNQSLINKSFATSMRDIVVSWLPFYHDMGLIGGILQPLYMGGSAVLMSPMDFLQHPIRWLEAISIYKGTISGGPNFAYDLCIKKILNEELKLLDLSSWKVAFNGAEKVRAETIESFSNKFATCGFRKSYFYPTYGLAEGTLFATGGIAHEDPIFMQVARKALENSKIVPAPNISSQSITLVSSGKAWDDQEVIVANPETHQICKNGIVGEIWLKGPSVTSGYWMNPRETDRCYKGYLSDNKGPYFRTGDLGFFQAGNLYVVGRIKDLVIINGRNIYPEDIEFEIQREIPGLKNGNGAVFSYEINNQEKIILVQEVEREKIRTIDRHIYNHINRIANETHSIHLDAVSLIMPHTLPKTTSGKVRRSTARQMFLKGELKEIECFFTDKIIEKIIQAKRASVEQRAGVIQ